MHDRIRAGKRALLVTICGVLSVAVFFRYQIGNHFTELFSNRYDGFIVLAILEHWHNFFCGLAGWSQTNFFYPFHDTLGYQDGYFANGMFYSAFRGLESVRRLYHGLQSFRSMRRIEASLRKASALRLRFSQSLANRRQRLSQAIVRSTIQRFGNATKPLI
jgi:hypothetical protein